MGDLSKHFSRHEFACTCGCGFDTVDIELIAILEGLRTAVGAPLRINSGCRCEEKNSSVGGSERSQHLYGRAADVSGADPQLMYDIVNKLYPNKFGLGVYSGWIHVDSRGGRARWGRN